MSITVMIQDAEGRGPDCDRIVLGMPGTFEELPRLDDRVEGKNGAGEYFTGPVAAVKHTFDNSTGTYVPEIFIQIDG